MIEKNNKKGKEEHDTLKQRLAFEDWRLAEERKTETERGEEREGGQAKYRREARYHGPQHILQYAGQSGEKPYIHHIVRRSTHHITSACGAMTGPLPAPPHAYLHMVL